MSGALLHDGRRSGHVGWCTRAIDAGVADGAIISPFSTPLVAAPRSPSGTQFAQAVSAAGAEVVFDPTTHARLLPGTDRLDHYDSWGLWGPAGLGLDSAARRSEHVERVFQHQEDLGLPHLAPTLALDDPAGEPVGHMHATAEVARELQPECWQALAGRRSFWRSSHLDAFVGRLAQLSSPVWVLTVINDEVADATPNLVDTAAFVGFSRTVHSLSLRSRVVVAHADFAGLPAVAAGADTVGTGWDRSMRTFDPVNYKGGSDGIRIPASLVTQGALTAVLRRDAAEAIERWNGPLAFTIRGGPMPPNDEAERHHHLRTLRNLIQAVNMQPDRPSRVQRMRQHYDNAGVFFDRLIGAFPARTVGPLDKQAWQHRPFAVLESYATDEGIW